MKNMATKKNIAPDIHSFVVYYRTKSKFFKS